MTLVVEPRVLELQPDALVHGSRTRATDRFTAGLLEAMRRRTCGVPEMWTGADSSGLTYRSRWSDTWVANVPTLQAVLPASTSVSAPESGSASDVRPPVVLPPVDGRSVTVEAAGLG